MANIKREQTEQLPLAEQLDDIGLAQGIVRNESESDADYAERMVYELDVYVEELWACQDKIRELVKVDE
jgi:hypothetical protein